MSIITDTDESIGRYKKAACHLETAPPCELCIRYNKECTFVESPAKRRRPNENNSENGQGGGNGMGNFRHDRNDSIGSNGPYTNGVVDGSGFDLQQDMLGWESGIAPFQMQSLDMGNGLHAPEFALDPAFYQDPSMAAFNAFEPMSATTTAIHPLERKFPQLKQGSSAEPEPSPRSASTQAPRSLSLPLELTSAEPSLDQQSSSNSTIVGLSGEADPYLLSRYRYNQYNDAAFQSIRIRRMNDGLGPDNEIPTFFTIQHNALASKAQPQERTESQERLRRELEEMVSDDEGKRLIRLFYRYVQPYFPVLSREGRTQERDEDGCREPKMIPTCLLAALYGHALPFCAWDEKLCVDVYTPPSAEAIFKIAWDACMASLHTPSYAGLQTLLLFVQRRPTNKNVSDTPFKGVMISSAVSIAQSLGLYRDPSSWPLPRWEIKQRRRLAWATYIQDKWLAFNSGRMGFIPSDDWDVDMLTIDDFAEQDKTADGPGSQAPLTAHHFIKLCELTLLVEDILRDLFSVKATKTLHASLEATLDAAKPLRIRLTEWHQNLPPGLLSQPTPNDTPTDHSATRRTSAQHDLEGNGSLHLAYITAKIALFRAMLRPRTASTPTAAVSALRTGAIAVAREVCDFLEQLNARELEAFWASYARTNFTIASSFILLLFVTAPADDEARECLELLNAWRSLLRIKSRSCDLLNLALLRLDGVFVAGMEELIDLSPAATRVWRESRGAGTG